MDNGARSYRRFLEGDESAFDEIMKELFQGLVFFINRYLHDVHAAEDIAIDAFSDLVVYRHRYNFKVPLKTYLYMIGRCRALDTLKHRKRIGSAELSEVEDLPDGERTPEEAVISDERRRAVNAAVAMLSEEMRDAVHLIYFEEMSYEDAARVMRKTRKQVDNLLYRAKKELRMILGKEGDFLL